MTLLQRYPTLRSDNSIICIKRGGLIVTNDTTCLKTEHFRNVAKDYVSKIGASLLPLRDFEGFAEMRMREKSFVALLFYEGLATGFIIGQCVRQPLYEGLIMTMEVFNTSHTGVLAARSVILAHEALAQRGRQLGADYASTTCYYKDTNHTLNKILAKNGWASQGYMSSLKLKE